MSIHGPSYFPVWPYYALATFSLTVAAVTYALWNPPVFPEQRDLVKYSGAVDRVQIRDDISGTTAGSVWPMLTSVYFMIEGTEGEFRYPYYHPHYFQVRDSTAGTLDIWVDGTATSDEPRVIWQLREHNSLNIAYPETNITFEEVTGLLTRISRSRLRLALWAFAAFAGFLGVGFVARQLNRKRGAQARAI